MQHDQDRLCTPVKKPKKPPQPKKPPVVKIFYKLAKTGESLELGAI